MHDYGYYDYGTSSTMSSGAIAALVIIYLILLAASIFCIVSLWKIFTKAGKPGWAAIIPVYNLVVLLEITELPMWYIALFFVPIGNLVVAILIGIELAQRFGKSNGFGVGLVFLAPVFYGILAFGKDSKYIPKSPRSHYNQNAGFFCVQCGNPVTPDAKFCVNCGNKMESNIKFCTHCGSVLDSSLKFCTNCGNNVK